MTLSFVVACSGVVFVVFGLWLRRRLPGRLVIPKTFAIGAIGLSLGFTIACTWMHAIGYRLPKATTVESSEELPINIRAAEDRPMEPGAVPALEAVGWVNGPPLTEVELSDKVVVVDVWVDW